VSAVYTIMKRRILLFTFLVPLVGCSGGDLPSREITLNESTVVQLGEAVLLRGEGTTVQLESVLEDSRCPPFADCVQAGQIRVRVRVIGTRGSFTQEAKMPILPTELLAPPESGYFVALTAVTPDGSFTPIPPANYRLTIRVSKVS
jgi:hypothetical protein